MKPEFERQLSKLQRESLLIGGSLLVAIAIVLVLTGMLIDWGFLCPK